MEEYVAGLLDGGIHSPGFVLPVMFHLRLSILENLIDFRNYGNYLW